MQNSIQKFLLTFLYISIIVPGVVVGQTNDSILRTTTDSKTTLDSQVTDFNTGKAVTDTKTTTNTDSSTTATKQNTTQTTDLTREIYQTEIPDGGTVGDIAGALQELDRQAQEVDSQIQVRVREGIDRSIGQIITSDPQVAAFKLQESVLEQTNNLYSEVDTVLFRQAPTDANRITELERRVDASLVQIERTLEGNSGVDVDLSGERESITKALTDFRTEIETKKEILNNRGGELLFQDTDNDGLSDYDETFIYGTDPANQFTVFGDLSDADKILNGINPLSKTNEPMQYEDPKIAETVVVSDLYQVTEIEVVKKDSTSGTTETDKEVVFRGRGLPNSFVTIYIFSTPIVVTVKTDSAGHWTYTLDKELENGDHEMYVTTVNNSGKIIARSNPVPFTKTAEAATIGLLGEEFTSGAEATNTNILKDNLLLIVLAVVVAAVIITLLFVGRNTELAGTAQHMTEQHFPDTNNPKNSL